ncbi:MAG: AAA family ATPase, partial [Sphingomonadaceae bacterium]|nr:AAA family ATPase [Sphingomonadaceae bacterium]
MNAPAGDLSRAASVSPIVGFFRSDEMRTLIASAFNRPGLGEATLNDGGIEVALKIMRRGDKPSVVIFDVSQTNNPVADIATIIKHGGRALPVIAIGEAIDLEQFRELLAVGMFDYIDRAGGAAPLADAVARARRLRARRATDTGVARQGRVIVFAGTRGGVGTTTAAIATAWTLANDCDTQTALVDLDLVSGTIAFALDIDPGQGLREGLDQPARIDAVFVERCLVRESPKLAVLSAEEPYDLGGDFDPAAALVLLDELRQTFDCIVVDLPRSVTPLCKVVLAAADDIVLMYSPTLAGLRDALRWMDLTATVADRAAVRLVQGPVPGTVAIDKAEFEKSLGRKTDLAIPFDAKAAFAAANAGKA